MHQWQANIYTRTFLDIDHGRGVYDDGNTSPGCRLSTPTSASVTAASPTSTAPTSTAMPASTRSSRCSTGTSSKPIPHATRTRALTSCTTRAVRQTAVRRTGQLGTRAPIQSDQAVRQLHDRANLAEHLRSQPASGGSLASPASVYCADADCTADPSPDIGANGSDDPCGPNSSTGRIDPPWVNSYGWQGFSGQNNFLEFGKKPFTDGENGGIHGHVVYASTRPFDDPQLLLQLSWEPLVPHVTLNLYQEDVAADGITQDTDAGRSHRTTSFDDWAQGFRSTDGSRRT